MTLYVKKFSTYAIAYDNNTSNTAENSKNINTGNNANNTSSNSLYTTSSEKTKNPETGDSSSETLISLLTLGMIVTGLIINKKHRPRTIAKRKCPIKNAGKYEMNIHAGIFAVI